MSFATRDTNDLIRIAAAGGGFFLNASYRSTEDLIRIAAAASSKQGRLVFTGLNARDTNDLIRISSAGKGCVQFEG